MRRQGPLSLRHLVVAVLAVVVVNAQMTWWIIFTIRENRARLGLERASMAAVCSTRAAAIASDLAAAQARLATVLAGSEHVPPAPPRPFVGLAVSAVPAATTGWRRAGDGLELLLPWRGRTVLAAADPAWARRLLDPPPGYTVAAGPDPSIPGVALPAPLGSLQLRPTRAHWEAVLSDYRRHIVMVVSEGSFFALLIFVMMGLLWKSLRREVELERQHQNFLSAITHELKSPLASIRLTLETLLRGRADSETSQRFLKHAFDDTERLQLLVQKVLEVTRYSAGRRSISLQDADLSALVDETVATFLRRAKVAGGEVDADIEPGISARVDPEAFPIALSNLLENAMKYGGRPPRAEVRLRAAGGRAVLTVRDNGPGIPEADLPLIFDRFFRGGDELRRTSAGTGLGLFLVKAIVSAHHGDVRVASTGSTGTTFRITLPGASVVEDQA